MSDKPILFCSSKGARHLALIAHLYGLPYRLSSENKVVLKDASWYAATFFTEKVKIKHPIKGHLSSNESLGYRDYIINHAKNPFNQINYSELLLDQHFEDLKECFTVIQLMTGQDYRRELTLRRFFHLYGNMHKDYMLLDQGLAEHGGSPCNQRRVITFMRAAGWKDEDDMIGFLRSMLSPMSPIMQAFDHEQDIKQKRQSIKLSYGDLFDRIDGYETICGLTGKTPNKAEWIDLLTKTSLPRFIYGYGRYWDLEKI